MYLPTWPTELQTEVHHVYRCILAHGTIDQTIPKLDEAALEATRQALLAFCERAEDFAP